MSQLALKTKLKRTPKPRVRNPNFFFFCRYMLGPAHLINEAKPYTNLLKLKSDADIILSVYEFLERGDHTIKNDYDIFYMNRFPLTPAQMKRFIARVRTVQRMMENQ